MDNLTHAFTAIACTHTVSRERPSGLTLAAAVLAANVQDLDWLPSLSLRPESIEVHRGTMHSLLTMPLLAIGTALGSRFVARRRGNGAPSPPFLPMLGICLVAAASHLLLDLLNPYGLRPLLPFDVPRLPPGRGRAFGVLHRFTVTWNALGLPRAPVPYLVGGSDRSLRRVRLGTRLLRVVRGFPHGSQRARLRAPGARDRLALRRHPGAHVLRRAGLRGGLSQQGESEGDTH